ncbi:hypothetical protein ASPWEDRAFT_34287 [Aspergillus wentii DTO 134E9]|uniref:O-methyltransferase C-terminal domain-containing protein n=1 Tax=Aspergillus wentii DTO 134E9 TaxID=1073089 RepID=A0A1L9S0Y6_ASPWE|nr:uncharacterized protein ASPWEDRAFT_34287 [Aspergillus wentii DTO 134E9]KAI9931189.1 hypothetical protein MW887_010849 [Aspergillus wentii]OJJ40803.1 hypothetical protein ASPWEDRAFT_34287 [Aspergillus wentii DTO 134E9]
MASPLTLLAEELLENCKALDAYNEANGRKPASFDYDTFVDLPLDVENRRMEVVDQAQDLKRLAQGSTDLFVELGSSFNDAANFHYIYHYNIPKYVPAEGDISYTELASATGLDEIMLRRMIRMAIMNRVFAETDGRVRHSAASRVLHDEPGAMDAAGFLLEEMFPSAPRMVEAMNKYPNSGEPTESPFNLAFNTSRPFYLELAATPERSRRFGSAMRWLSKGGRFSDHHMVRGYDWATIDHEDAVLVDVGGGHGTVSIALANATQKMKFVVQDLPLTTEQGAKMLAEELKERVSFMPHDFFAENPVKGADVYFFRYILHNWSDKYAERILKAVVPAMKVGSRIVCYEFLPGDGPTTAWSEKQPYNMDILQIMGYNSIERTSSDWERLFRSVDSRLKYLGTRTPPGCSLSFIEAQLDV